MPKQLNKRRYAALDGIKTLYKFRSYASAQDRQIVREILVDHKVYFARASQLNDKRDLRPLLRFRGSSEDKTRELLLSDAAKTWARHTPPYSSEEIAALRQRLATMPLEQLEIEARQRTHQRLDEYYWVFSLSASRDYVDMWNDYADQGRGLCVHFRSDRGSPFGIAQRVLYRSKAPVLWVPLGSDRTVADVSVLTKTLRWKREREYRMVRYPALDRPGIPMRFDGQHAHFPAWLLAGITVGINMPPEHVQEIVALAEAHDPPLVVWRPTTQSAR